MAQSVDADRATYNLPRAMPCKSKATRLSRATSLYLNSDSDAIAPGNFSAFVKWEAASRDTIDFKRAYVDMAGNLLAGLLLSQIVYWYLPSKDGHSKLRVERDGYMWLAKGRSDWWNEIRMRPREIDAALKVLSDPDVGLIETRRYKFAGAPTIHIRIVDERFLQLWDEVVSGQRMRDKKRCLKTKKQAEKGGDGNEIGFNELVKSGGAKNAIHELEKTKSPNSENQIPDQSNENYEFGKTYTEITAEITPEILQRSSSSASHSPAASQDGDDEQNEITSKQSERSENMIKHLMAITNDRSEMETLRNLTLQCVQIEHKSAWIHTLDVLKDKMALVKKPACPNLYAATVLRNALASMESASVREHAKPPPQVANCAHAAQKEAGAQEKALIESYYDNLDIGARHQIDAEAEIATCLDFRKSQRCIKATRNMIIAERLGLTVKKVQS